MTMILTLIEYNGKICNFIIMEINNDHDFNYTQFFDDRHYLDKEMMLFFKYNDSRG